MAGILQRLSLNTWTYAPVTEAGGASTHMTWGQYLKEYLRSKAFWRAVLVVTVVALLADIFHPTRKVLEHHGWVNPDSDATKTTGIVAPVNVSPPMAVTSSIEPPAEHAVEHPASPGSDNVDWSQYAYCQYVTSDDYLCNSVMIFESLTKLGAKAEKLMMYPHHWSLDDTEFSWTRPLLLKARDEYGVKLMPIEVQHFGNDDTWGDSFTKLLAFNQTQYKRVLSLDSDSTVLQHMDELFLMPSAPVAMPRAYWLPEQHTLSSQLMLVEPSEFEFERIRRRFEHHKMEDFDMEIVNGLYGKDCLVIPHRKYDLLTGEFRGDRHRNYLGSEEAVWDAEKVLAEAKFLHFSDWPLPKPWMYHKATQFQEVMPKCQGKDCRNREVWKGIYADFLARRERICGVEFLPKEQNGRRARRRSMQQAPSKFEAIF